MKKATLGPLEPFGPGEPGRPWKTEDRSWRNKSQALLTQKSSTYKCAI